MTSSAAAKESETKKSAPEAGALLFVLEGIGSDARKVSCDALKSAVQDQGAKFSPALFARNGFHADPSVVAAGVAESITEKKLNAGKIAEALTEALDAHVSKLSKLPDPLAKLVDAAVKRGMIVAVVTALPEEKAAAAMQRAGYGEGAIQIFAYPDATAGFPRADIWIKAAKSLGKSTRACVAVVDDSTGCKSALSAGMKCIAVPNALATHQDFGGADVVLDAWDEMTPREMLDAAIPVK